MHYLFSSLETGSRGLKWLCQGVWYAQRRWPFSDFGSRKLQSLLWQGYGSVGAWLKCFSVIHNRPDPTLEHLSTPYRMARALFFSGALLWFASVSIERQNRIGTHDSFPVMDYCTDIQLYRFKSREFEWNSQFEFDQCLAKSQLA